MSQKHDRGTWKKHKSRDANVELAMRFWGGGMETQDVEILRFP